MLQLPVQTHQHVDRLLVAAQRRAKRREPRRKSRTGGRGVEKRNQLLGERVRVLEWIELRVRLDKEIERIDHRHVGDQIDDDVERTCVGSGKTSRATQLPYGILLPVEEIVRRLDVQRIAKHRSAAMRRRPQRISCGDTMTGRSNR